MDRPAIWGGLSIGPAPRCAPGLRCERVGAGPVTMPAALGMCSYAKARVTAGAGLPSIRPFAPLSQSCRPRRQGDRPEGVRPPLPPPMSARTRCRKAMQTAPSSPLPGPRRRTGRRRRSVDERASVWAARRSVGDRASAPPAVDGFSRRGRREGGVTTRAAGRQGGRALPHPARPISHPPHPSPSRSRPAMGAVFERHFL